MNLRALDKVGTDVTNGPFDEVLTGDPGAIRAFILIYGPVIRRAIRHKLFGPGGLHGRLATNEDVSDLAQQTYLVLFRDGGERLRRYDAQQRMSPAGWIALCAETQATNYLQACFAAKRGTLRVVQSTDPEEDPIDRAPSREADPEQRATTRQSERALRATLEAELSPKERLAFKLLILEELEISEVCALMNITQADAYQLRHRIREKVRRILRRQEEPR